MVKVTATLLKELKKSPLDVLRTLSNDDIATIIQKANHSYYNTKTPLFSDNLYDMIREYLQQQDPNHPILKAVGNKVQHGEKVKLPFYMGSLDKIKADQKALDKYKLSCQSTSKSTSKGDYVVSDKLDGNSALIYITSNGSVSMYSRGDGSEGQEITHLIPYIKKLPKFSKTYTKDYAVRGELIISKCDFEHVKDKGANARNMVAGIVNAKLPDVEIAQRVQFVAYELLTPTMTPEKQLQTLNDMGFRVVDHKVVDNESLTLENLSDFLVNRRDASDFEIDGIVVMHNKEHKYVANQNPTYAFAFKSILTMQSAEVIVSGVEWNLSKDGYLIPVVIFNPVNLAGVSIKRATGFNGKYILDNKIGPGSRIVIMRSGDVIPYITDVLSPSETGEAQMPEMKYTWTKSKVDIMLNTEAKQESDELRLKNIIYFFDKVDVKGLSSGTVTKIYNSGKKTVKDILYITKEELLDVDGFKDKMADKIWNAIQERVKTLDCITVMAASNTLGRGIGAKKLEVILEEIPNIITKRYIPSEKEMLSIKGIEKTTASLFISNLPSYFKFVDDNKLKCIFEGKYSSTSSIEVEEQPPSKKKKTQGDTIQDDVITSSIAPALSPMVSMTGTKFVFTGFRNEILEKLIKTRGGVVTTSVSKSTTAVVCKDDKVNESSTKTEKAESLGVPVMTLSAFLKKYKIKLA